MKFWGFLFGIFLLFWYLGVKRLDPDFGWHYMAGKYILNNGHVADNDEFSYTMSNFHFIDHEWLYNLGIVLIYDKFGFLGLGLISSLAIVFSLLLIAPFKTKEWSVLPILLLMPIWISRAGVRPQVFSWLFLAVFMRIWREPQNWKRYRYFIPLFFCFWANIHGSFLIGILMFGFVVLCDQIQKKKIIFSDWIVFILSLVVTLINPYGVRLWYEVWMQLTDSQLKFRIVEWMPFYHSFELAPMIATAILASLLSIYRKLLPAWEVGLLIIVFIAGLSSLRHMAFYNIVATPVFIVLLNKFYNDVRFGKLGNRKFSSEDIKISIYRTDKFYLLIKILAIILFSVSVSVSVFTELYRPFNKMYYPIKAVDFLKNNTIKKNMFSLYGWGGYLDWKLSNQKVFIDGRMPSWRYNVPFFQSKNMDVYNSENAMDEYVDIVDNGNWKKYFEKYNVSTVLWTNESEVKIKSGLLRNIENILTYFNNLLNNNKKAKKNTFVDDLIKEDWKVIYSDDVSIVYEKD